MNYIYIGRIEFSRFIRCIGLDSLSKEMQEYIVELILSSHEFEEVFINHCNKEITTSKFKAKFLFCWCRLLGAEEKELFSNYELKRFKEFGKSQYLTESFIKGLLKKNGCLDTSGTHLHKKRMIEIKDEQMIIGLPDWLDRSKSDIKDRRGYALAILEFYIGKELILGNLPFDLRDTYNSIGSSSSADNESIDLALSYHQDRFFDIYLGFDYNEASIEIFKLYKEKYEFRYSKRFQSLR